jgi:hypothetical protein
VTITEQKPFLFTFITFHPRQCIPSPFFMDSLTPTLSPSAASFIQLLNSGGFYHVYVYIFHSTKHRASHTVRAQQTFVKLNRILTVHRVLNFKNARVNDFFLKKISSTSVTSVTAKLILLTQMWHLLKERTWHIPLPFGFPPLPYYLKSVTREDPWIQVCFSSVLECLKLSLRCCEMFFPQNSWPGSSGIL